MAELGYVEGQNLAVEVRGYVEERDEPAAELARQPVDVIVATGTPAVRGAVNATASIPIVMLGGVPDPVAPGFVDSLARPGRNVTGFISGGNSGDPVALDLKRLELLVEGAPHVS